MESESKQAQTESALDDAVNYAIEYNKSALYVAEMMYGDPLYDGELHLAIGTFRKKVAKKLKELRGERHAKKGKAKPAAKSIPDPEPKQLSAWHPVTELVMGIEEYCTFYGFPIDQVRSYKLVSHTGTPFYNILFYDVVRSGSVLTEGVIERIVKKHIFSSDFFIGLPLMESRDLTNKGWFDWVAYSDTHIGMDVDKEGVAMYPTPWNKDEQLRRARVMVEEIIKNRKGVILYLDELGDFMDGYNGYTTRQGHKLPQNMTNEEAFEVGVAFKMLIIDELMPWYEKIVLHNICNDNHAGSFGYVVNSTVMHICKEKYGAAVEIINQKQFINHYIVGRHAFVNTHGKDSKALKFGFKVHLDDKQVSKIDAYLKYHKLYDKADFIQFAKGDSHQMLLDCCTSDDFDYLNLPAFSPASEWVQTNFKKSRSGFVIQHVKYNENEKELKAKWF